MIISLILHCVQIWSPLKKKNNAIWTRAAQSKGNKREKEKSQFDNAVVVIVIKENYFFLLLFVQNLIGPFSMGWTRIKWQCKCVWFCKKKVECIGMCIEHFFAVTECAHVSEQRTHFFCCCSSRLMDCFIYTHKRPHNVWDEKTSCREFKCFFFSFFVLDSIFFFSSSKRNIFTACSVNSKLLFYLFIFFWSVRFALGDDHCNDSTPVLLLYSKWIDWFICYFNKFLVCFRFVFVGCSDFAASRDAIQLDEIYSVLFWAN